MQREGSALAADRSEPSAADRVAKIFSLKASILAGGSNDAADQFAIEVATLAREVPTQGTRDVLDALLSTEALDRFVDGAGVPCRVAVVNALLALGFPYALEVSPPDLQLVRAHAPKRWSLKPLSSAALFSMLWSAGWLAVIFSDAPSVRSAHLLFASPFLLAGAHASASMAGTFIKHQGTRQKLFSTLAWMGLLGPAASGLLAIFTQPLFLIVGLFYATPAMIVAWLAGKEAKKLRGAT